MIKKVVAPDNYNVAYIPTEYTEEIIKTLSFKLNIPRLPTTLSIQKILGLYDNIILDFVGLLSLSFSKTNALLPSLLFSHSTSVVDVMSLAKNFIPTFALQPVEKIMSLSDISRYDGSVLMLKTLKPKIEFILDYAAIITSLFTSSHLGLASHFTMAFILQPIEKVISLSNISRYDNSVLMSKNLKPGIDFTLDYAAIITTLLTSSHLGLAPHFTLVFPTLLAIKSFDTELIKIVFDTEIVNI